MANLTDFKCLVFDCYGTLVDWESGIFMALQPLLSRLPEPISRAQALEAFGAVESEVQKEHPTMLYSDILTETHRRLGSKNHFNVSQTPTAEEHRAFGASVANWEPFPDTKEALTRLSKHYKLVILSNIDRSSFAHTQAKLQSEGDFAFDKVITAEEIGSYKPDVANFEYALKAVKQEFGIESNEVLVTAQSLYHDHVPANRLGLSSAWIARENALVGVKDVQATYTFKFETLGAMADEVDKRFAS